MPSQLNLNGASRSPARGRASLEIARQRCDDWSSAAAQPAGCPLQTSTARPPAAAVAATPAAALHAPSPRQQASRSQ
ncbi:uncharacterized protein SCHCODRAFT_02632671 [Schizophyllum commune H4-8]|uniref:uncharacterized protein n=1 Tax=Schizophyllum commune (strain H4-8 / FGSC 9210) TaxID=578458 RepID=UPI00215EE44D|nr:uncharacterized protein SCHCODRAFT_02632671 [Schizophyllum commune H4-8]KAI5890708.1 hypothetical protein SCHCODRAFT_02632671 [Schizophyllum commune H4-8]